MSELTKTYQVSRNTRNWLLFAGLICAFLSAISVIGPIGSRAWGSAVLYGIPSLLLLVGAFALSSYRVTVSDGAISTHQLNRRRTARWDEVNKVTNRGNDLVLHTRATSVRLSSQVDGYTEIVDLLSSYRPDLWSVAESRIFQSEGSSRLLYGVAALGMAMVGIRVLIVSPALGWASLISVIPFVIAGLALYVLLNKVQLLVLRGDQLLLRYLLRERLIMASEITVIHFHRVFALVGGANYGVSIALKDGGGVTLSGVKDGSAVLYLILAEWWKECSGLRE